MARIGAPPETHYTLPPDFAAALGQCVANFGWLEEIIKRTIYALDRARLADDLAPLLYGGGAYPRLSDAGLVKLFRLLRLARRLVDLEAGASASGHGA